MPLEAGNVGYLTQLVGLGHVLLLGRRPLRFEGASGRGHRGTHVRHVALGHVAPTAAGTSRQHEDEHDGDRDEADEAGADEDVRAGHREAAALCRLLRAYLGRLDLARRIRCAGLVGHADGEG